VPAPGSTLTARLCCGGKVPMNTGNRVVGTPGRPDHRVWGDSLAGYIEANSGRQLTFMVGVSNVPIAATPAEFEHVTGDPGEDCGSHPTGLNAPSG